MTFYFPYYGNKKKECKHFNHLFDPQAIDTVVEPFCGTFAFSLHCYYALGMKDCKYVLCDNDLMLCKFLIDVKANGSKKYFDFVNNIVCNDFTKAKHNLVVSKCDDDMLHWFYTKKCFQFRPKLFPKRQVGKAFVRTKGHELVDAFLKLPNVSIACQSYEATLEQQEANERTLMFIDPPFLDSCNSTYSDSGKVGSDATKYYRDLKHLIETKGQADVICVLNHNAYCRLYLNHKSSIYTV